MIEPGSLQWGEIFRIYANQLQAQWIGAVVFQPDVHRLDLAAGEGNPKKRGSFLGTGNRDGNPAKVWYLLRLPAGQERTGIGPWRINRD